MIDNSPRRRRGKEIRERVAAAVALIAATPLFVACAVAVKAEAIVNRGARGPVFFREERISRGRIIRLVKFRTLTAAALASLEEGPTHIATLERAGQVTRVGGWLKQWYLDELPQLWNIVKGDMFLIGTRPYPIELYEREMAAGITRKRDMPAGLVGPVQAHKGAEGVDDLALDQDYWDAFCNLSAWKLLRIDVRILLDTLRVQLQHRGL